MNGKLKITRTRIFAAAAAGALAFNLYAGFAFIKSAAPTYDEPVHLASGYLYLKTGNYAAGPIIRSHPPFAEMVAALPLLSLRLKTFTDSPFFSPLGHFRWGDAFVYDNTAPAEAIVNSARRLIFIVWTALLALFIFLLARGTDSEDTAYLSLFLYAFTPAFISNNALIMTDAAPAVFYAGTVLCAFMFSRGLKDGSVPAARWWLLGTAVNTGLAMASKFSMAFLPGFVAAMWFIEPWSAGLLKKNLKRVALSAAAYMVLTALTVAAVYRFSQADMYIKGLLSASSWLSLDRVSFVNGRYFTDGVWWYFPYAFLIQTPVSLIALSLCGLASSVKRLENRHLWLYAPAVFYAEFALTAKMQIGYRHLLPVMPFLVIAAAVGLRSIISGKYSRLAALGLAGWLVFSTAGACPYYISYFNEAAGGPQKSWRRLVESSAGQDLKSLAEYLKKEGNPPVYLAYFGTARPEYYGIKYVPLITNEDLPHAAPPQTPPSFTRQLVAISVTNLEGIYITDKNFFSWLDRREPVYRAGNTIFLYDLTADREGVMKIAETLYKQKLSGPAAYLKAKALAIPPAPAARGQVIVTAAVFSPDGKLAVWADTAGRLTISAPRAGAAPLTSRLDFSASSLMFSPDSSRIFAGCLDGRLRVIRAADGFPLGNIKAHEWDILSLTVSRDGKYLVSSSVDGKIKIWNIRDMKLVKIAAVPSLPAFFTVFSGDSGHLISADLGGSLDLWDLKEGRPLPYFMDRPGYALNAAAVSPDLKYLAYGGYGRKLKILDLPGRIQVCERAGFSEAIRSAAFSPDGKRLAVTTSGGELKLLDIPGCQASVKFKDNLPGGIYAAGFSPDGLSINAVGEAGGTAAFPAPPSAVK